jgi:hypothetical protein
MQLSHLLTKPDLVATPCRNPELLLHPIKTMDQYFNGLHHGAIMVQRT